MRHPDANQSAASARPMDQIPRLVEQQSPSSGMAKIGDRASLKIIREKPFGLILDGGEAGEILLPRREVPVAAVIGGCLEVFLYHDSEDRPVATQRSPPFSSSAQG